MAKERTKGKPVRNREALTDMICEAMHKMFPSRSIDQLLCHPTDAIRVATVVGVMSGQIKNNEARHIMKAVKTIDTSFLNAGEVIPEICRTALSSRKRGDLKLDRY